MRSMVMVLKLIVPLVVCAIGQSADWPWTANSRPVEVCYESLGCFSEDSSGTLPYSPEYVGTKFYLATRNTTDEYEELVVTDDHKNCSWKSFFEGTRRIIVIVHGYRSYVHGTWVEEMARELLVNDDYSVIMVDWTVGAAGPWFWYNEYSTYRQAVANGRVVGAQIAQLLDVLKNAYNIDPANVHIIGHSLGAHVAGLAGESVDKIGRITGLDPAVHEFNDNDTKAHLDKTDAMFVDVIHTDMVENRWNLWRISDFGTSKSSGTVDFFPNEGKDQPGCPNSNWDHIKWFITGYLNIITNAGCSHIRATEYFTESINSHCNFTAYPSQQNQTCGPTGCGVMGFHTSPSLKPGKYFLTTNSSAPYCVE